MAIGCVFHILFANVQNIFCYTLAWFSKITSLFNHIVIYAQVCGCWSVDCCAWLLPTTDQITDFSRLLVLHLWPATWLPYSRSFLATKPSTTFRCTRNSIVVASLRRGNAHAFPCQLQQQQQHVAFYE